MHNLILNNPLVYLFRTMWAHARKNKRNIITYFTLFVIAYLMWGAEPLMVGYFFNEIQRGGINPENIKYLLTLLGVFALQEVLFWVFHGTGRVIENKTAFLIRAEYKRYLLKGIMAFPIEWHTDHHSGDTIDKIEKGTSGLFNFSSNISKFLQVIILITFSVIAVFYYDFEAASFVILFSIPTFIIIALFDKRLIPGYIKVNVLENKLAEKVFDTLSNITTVIILRVESLVFRTINVAIEKPFDQFSTNAKLTEWKWTFAGVFGRIAIATVIGIYIYKQMYTGAVLVGTIYILYGYVNQIKETFFSFAYLYNDVIRYRINVKNAEEISKDFKGSIGAKKNYLPKLWTEININNLSFSYHGPDENKSELHIDDLNMKIKKGERIALIGESGGGKSTFLKLVRDLYHAKKLNLSIDNGKVLNSFSSISNSISLIPQDPEIFATTIRENITLGVEYKDSVIKKFTDMAQFTETIKRLPKGLDSSIVEKGVNLSGGEKQRLALARGLLASADKDIILLDEPTSSVDFNNELDIYKNIFESFPKKTILSSIHRLHLLSLFDSIYFFKDGKVIANGTLEELKNNSDEFKILWQNYINTRDSVIPEQ